MTTHFSFLFQLSPPSVLHGTAPERARSWLAPVTTVMFLPALFAMSSGCCQNNIRRIPTIRGRVIEAKTNRPIAGARLARWFEREDGCLAPGGSDVHSVPDSFLAVTSGQDGSFEWPAWTSLASPIQTMRWYIYHPDWVAGDGWFNQPQRGLAGYAFGTSSAEPWVHLDSHPAGSHLEVTVTMEPKDSTAAWEAHFQRMKSLTQYGKLDADYFVKEAVGYANERPLTEGMLAPLAELAGRLRSPGHSQLEKQRYILLRAISNFCHAQPVSIRCEWPIVSNLVRDFDQDYPRQMTPP